MTQKEPEHITLFAELNEPAGPSLDPKNHDVDTARKLAEKLCETIVEAYYDGEQVRPETLAVGVQTALETLLSGFEREGVQAGVMRVALANSLLTNGKAQVKIEVDGKPEAAEIPETRILH